MKRALFMSVAGGLLLALSAAGPAWAKAHVPLNKVQICHAGVVITVGEAAMGNFLAQGACRLPACDFENIFQTGDECDNTPAGGGFCELENEPNPAEGVTAACTPLF